MSDNAHVICTFFVTVARHTSPPLALSTLLKETFQLLLTLQNYVQIKFCSFEEHVIRPPGSKSI